VAHQSGEIDEAIPTTAYPPVNGRPIMADNDRHWRYALAVMLLPTSFALGIAIIFHTAPLTVRA